MIHGYAEPGETIEVIVIVSDYVNARHNLALLLRELCTEMNVSYTPLKTYEQLAISKRGDVKLPLMGIVYQAYFAKQYQKSFSDSALSQQRDAFFHLLGIDKHAHTWLLPEQEAKV